MNFSRKPSSRPSGPSRTSTGPGSAKSAKSIGASGPAAKRSGSKKLKVRSHHRHSGQLPVIEPAPECLPEGGRMPVSVQLQGWRSPLACSLVRVDEKSKQILLALPDNVQVAHKAESGESAVIGWPGHSVWHESRTSVSGKMKPGSKFFWLRLTSVPIHNERRRFVRAHQVRPISIHSGRDRVRATTMDVSEAALRVVMGQGDPIHSGDKVHMLFNTMQRHLGSIVSLAIDGHVYRTRELGEGSAGRKEVVIFFENLSPSQEDFIRGLVYDMDLQHKKPNTEEE